MSPASRLRHPHRFRCPAPVALTGLAALAVAAAPAPATAQEGVSEAVPTRLVVRVVANDAKIIGSGVGGAQVVVRDALTGAVLAQGVQSGGTGDTGLIMSPSERGARVFDTEGAAAFRAEIPLRGPTPVLVEYAGPLGTPHALQRGSTSLLLLPGEHLDGEGLVVTLHGFTVEMLAPTPSPFAAAPGEPVTVRARVTMLCGCPTQPGGLWDADGFDIRAQWVRDGVVVGEAPLTWTGTVSEYSGDLTAPAEGGPVTLRVVSVDRARVNSGMVEAPGLVH
ncbi:MAG: hypothetical protein RQ751_10340 [Longimicrobiales bacterium]|nr:hypothetical protein [Longimicrobiales bacterium]